MNMRVLAIAKKEVIQLLRDPKSIPLIILVPMIQVILFGYIAATDIRNIKFAVIDYDKSSVSREIITKIERSGFFVNRGKVQDYGQLEKLMDGGKIKIGLIIPPGFGRDLSAKKQPSLQVLVDGTDSNTASIAQNYFLQTLLDYAAEKTTQSIAGMNSRGDFPPIIFKNRNP